MKITLEMIRAKVPCSTGWETLLESKGYKTTLSHRPCRISSYEQFEITDVLDSNGILDAVWCLDCFDRGVYEPFLKEVTDTFEVETPDGDEHPYDYVDWIVHGQSLSELEALDRVIVITNLFFDHFGAGK
jgi:hypothetical protein